MTKRRLVFNINEQVRVRLTAVGLAIHRADHDHFAAALPAEAAAKWKEYTPPKVDSDGFWSTSAWHLMQLFGPHIYLGCQVPFEPTIEIDADVPCDSTERSVVVETGAVDEAAVTNWALRAVYEASRRVLRFNGVDRERVDAAFDEMADAVEVVKRIDGGYWEDAAEENGLTPAAAGLPHGTPEPWIPVSERLPVLDGERIYIGVNSAGFAACFNDMNPDGCCLMGTAEACTAQMSELRWWRPLELPERTPTKTRRPDEQEPSGGIELIEQGRRK